MRFPLVKEIKSKSGELHFRRWAIVETAWLRIYLHFIAAPDYDLHLHTHPWHFFSLVLKGTYVEQTVDKDTIRIAPTIAFRWYNTAHKILRVLLPCWTLVFAFGKRKEWGYRLKNGNFIQHDVYRRLKHDGKLDLFDFLYDTDHPYGHGALCSSAAPLSNIPCSMCGVFK